MSKVFSSDSYVHINRAESQPIATTFEGVTNLPDLQTGKVINEFNAKQMMPTWQEFLKDTPIATVEDVVT